jgi:hypothetical protein
MKKEQPRKLASRWARSKVRILSFLGKHRAPPMQHKPAPHNKT